MLGQLTLVEGIKQVSIETSRSWIETLHLDMERMMASPDAQSALESMKAEVLDGNPNLETNMTELRNPFGEVVAEVPTAEKQLYDEAGLHMEQVNGNDVMVRSDIDPNQLDARGRMNIERMESGLAPIDHTGHEIELHHIRQNPDGPLAELRSSEHEGNFKLLHPDLNSPSAIDRAEFAKVRAEHWKERAEMIKAGTRL